VYPSPKIQSALRAADLMRAGGTLQQMHSKNGPLWYIVPGGEVTENVARALLAREKIEESLHEMAPDAEIYFERIAVTPAQIEEWNLPTRPTKTSDTRAKHFGEVSVELDAIEPDTLRTIVRDAIELHLSAEKLEVLKAAEQSDRELIARLVGEVSS
jgi:hypothetical protein